MNSFKISGNIVDIIHKQVFHAELNVKDGRISSIVKKGDAVADGNYILPGFIDSHVHVESSMLIPSEFARYVKTSAIVARDLDGLVHRKARCLALSGLRFWVLGMGSDPLSRLDHVYSQKPGA